MPPQRPTSRRPRVADFALLLTLLVAAACAYAAVSTERLGPIRWASGPFELRIRDSARPLIASGLLSLVVPTAGWKRRPWRLAGLAGMAVTATLALLFLPTTPTFPIGDQAIIEFDIFETLRAKHLLGVYSQFGWRHPGPLMFYWLAPFYYLSSYSSAGIAIGVLICAVLSTAQCARVIALDPTRHWPFPLVFFSLVLVYVHLLPATLWSIWNPHVPLLPLLALIVTIAGAIAHRIGLVPVVVVLASFIVQAHVGFALVVASLCALLVVSHAIRAWREPLQRPPLLMWWMAALLIGEALWFLPLAEQVVNSPGNMTRIWQFFTSGAPGQEPSVAWRAWGTNLGVLFRSDLTMAWGGRFYDALSGWPRAIGIAAFVGLVPAAIRAARQQRYFMAALALASLVASVSALVSVLRVVATLGEYQIFWISIIGLLNLAIVLSEALHLLLGRFAQLGDRTVSAITCLGVAGVAWLGVAPKLEPPQRMDRRTRELLSAYDQTVTKLPAAAHPVIAIGVGQWADGAGFVLQAVRRGWRVSVTPDAEWMFGRSMVANGSEDYLVTFGRTDDHLKMIERPGNFTLVNDTEGFYVDAISLVDHPELRP